MGTDFKKVFQSEVKRRTIMSLIKIDRSRSWFSIIGASSPHAKSIWENPDAKLITEVDFGKVELLPLISGGLQRAGVNQKDFDQSIFAQLENYKKKGFVLLDGAVVKAMLNSPDSIPSAWSRMTDSESFDEGSAVIRFDGSVFTFSNQPEELVCQPFTSRGRWGWGFGPRFPELVAENGRPQMLFTPQLTAALRRPSSCIE
jgi:hypothetical protein